MKYKKILIIFLFLINLKGFAQEIKYNLEWQQQSLQKETGEKLIYSELKDCGLDNGVPFFYAKEEVKFKNATVKIKSIDFELAPEIDKNHLNSVNFNVPEDLKITYKVTAAGNQNYFVVHAIPYKKVNNQLFRLKNISFEITKTEAISSQKDFVENSVLREGSGTWFKISVQRDGIYKIDKSFLESCGINTSNLNPNHIHIYGNGDGVIPELNSVYRPDDLVNNSIFIAGDQDGSFDANDYILFNAWGPHKWNPNGTAEFEQLRNPYSDFSYYFININSSISPNRIATLPLNDNNADTTFTNYDFRDVYENDLLNLVSGGQRWYGELFDIELERTINFSIPNIDTAPIRFKSAMASNAVSSSGTSQRFSVNNQILLDELLPGTGGTDFSRSTKSFTLANPPSTIPLKITVTRNNPNMLTYLDRILLNTKRKLVFYGTQFGFRSLIINQPTKVAAYTISNFPSNGFVWDVSDRQQPKRVTGVVAGSNFTFKTSLEYKEYVASNGSSFFTPELVGPVAYQNLHGLPQADYLIVTHSDFISQANRLADLHREEGLTVHVATTDAIFNEFSSGAKDAGAIRMFAKMFYDRGATNPSTRPKYLLLFGDGTFDPKDRVSNNNNYVLTYQVENSENHIAALVTDDFFGMLDDNESIESTDMLDIGIGRILASNVTQAKQQVDKIEHYMKNGSSLFANQGASCCLGDNSANTYGDWRLKYVQVADDEEGAYFLKYDTEPQYNWVKKNHREMNCDKLYMDAFPQQTSAGGQRYPDVFNAITDRVQRGALIVNYVGHGGEVGLAEERVVTIPQIQSWNNINAMNLFVSATCEFTKYDDPSRVSAGEWASLNPNGAAIALMTTTRSVYFGVNSNTGLAFYRNVFQRDAQGNPRTFGEIVRRTKNEAGNSDNKRSFTLIGDPALKIALPKFKIVTDSINGKNPLVQVDTLKALSKVTIKGHLENFNGDVLNDFSGVVVPSIFDKIKTQKTLGQDPSSPVMSYELQRNIVYKGKDSIKNGYFEFSFVVPKDIALNYGDGKISYYAFNDNDDAFGYDTTFVIGGIDPSGIEDNQGPTLEAFMNDEKFINGSVTDTEPVLLLKAFDENGINTVGNGIGHDILAILDGDIANPINLNDFYVSELDNFQRGEIRYQLKGLEKGKHTLEIKVWDVNNNSSTVIVDFVVQEKEEPKLDHVYNYPNPFTTKTSFMFEHNQACNSLETQIQIFTVSGRLVKTINTIVPTTGFRSEGIEWDGKDEYEDQLAKGVYVYRLKIKNSDGLTTEKTEKLVILR
ncbi:MAG: type IX secretion system sortase PorU [Flavobacteriales bacterium]|nr:type IX secretion system sortase PorU [Flavobacteriales bacterium]